MPHFETKLPHFVINTSPCSKIAAFCNRKPDASSNKLLPYLL